MKSMVAALLALAACSAAFADITLVRDGQPQAVIIVPDGLYKHVQKPTEQIASQAAWCRGVARNLIRLHWEKRQSAKVVADSEALDAFMDRVEQCFAWADNPKRGGHAPANPVGKAMAR